MTNHLFEIERIEATLIELPLKQPIPMSFGVVSKTQIVLVSLLDRNGVEGFGEASILGGPFWGSDSAEGTLATIVRYLAPQLAGKGFDGPEQFSKVISSLVKGNAPARSALTMAALDLAGKRLGISAVNLLGGPVRTSVPVSWTLATGSTEGDIDEAFRAIEERGHTRFKVKLASTDLAAQVKRVEQLCHRFSGVASFIADANQGWDERTVTRYLPQLDAAGLEAIEQPLPSGQEILLRPFRERLAMEIIADESLTSLQQALSIAGTGGVTAFSLKPNRDGGVFHTRRVATIAEAANLKLYGGTALESSLGTAAYAALYASLPNLQLGSEIFGPLRVTRDIVSEPLRVSGGHLQLPDGPGLGVQPDLDLIAFLKTSR